MAKSKFKSRDGFLLKLTFYIIVGIFALICLFPFVLMIISSFMEEKEILAEGFKLFPKTFTTSAYTFLLKNPKKLIDAYTVTIIITVVGTAFGLLIMSMAGYVLSRNDFKYRNQISLFIYFTTLFSGGLVPSYILMTNYLGLRDNILAMILPGMVSAWSIFLMRNFMKAIPDSLYESAIIDGASDFTVYRKVFMPLAIPSLATIGLFLALGYWTKDVLSSQQSAKDNFINGLSASYITHMADWTGSYGATNEKLGLETDFYCFPEALGKILRKMGIENGTGISSNSNNPERALMAIEKFMTDESYYKLIQYGIEGVQYEVVDGLSDRPEGYDEAVDGGGFAVWSLRNDKFNIPYDSDLVATDNSSLSGYNFGFNMMNQLLTKSPDLTAVFAFADPIAIGTAKAILASGLRIPDDISIIGFDGIKQAEFFHPSLDTFAQPADQMALSSVELLFDMINGGESQQIIFESSLIRRGSCINKDT